MLRLNLGCSDRHLPGYINVDVFPPADLITDLNGAWPWDDNSVDEIVAHDIIEHLTHKIFTMNQLWRVLKPGGVVRIKVPTTDGPGAFQDPGHCCHDDKTEVLTTDGFRLFSELTGEEQVMTLNPDTWEAEPSQIEKVHCYDFDGDMVRFSGRGIDALVTPNHRLYVGSSDDATPFRMREAADMLEFRRPCRVPHGVKFTGDTPEYFEIPGSRLINESNPQTRFVGDTVRLEIQPFLEFMGWFISEGSCTITKDGSRVICVAQSERAKPEYFERIGLCLQRLGVRAHRTKNGWRFCNLELGNWLRQFGHSHEKYIPRSIMDLHPDLQQHFFDSAMLGDGNKKSDDSWTYGTTSNQLASDIAEMGLRLGFRVNIGKEARIGKSLKINPDYRAKHDMNLVYISQCKHRYLTNGRLEKYVGKVHCVSAKENYIICTRRNGRVLWSGNSFWHRNSFWYYTDGDAHRERFGNAYGIEARFRVVHEQVHLWQGIPTLEIHLQAVKPQNAQPLEQPSVEASPSVIDQLRGSSVIGTMRIKNESQWIKRSIESQLGICDKVLVLDDGSTDDTRDIVRGFGTRCVLIESPFEGVDEGRDKSFLLKHLIAADPEWALWIDGDEVLEDRATALLYQEMQERSFGSLSMKVLYFWDDENKYRVDGVYANLHRPSAFRVRGQDPTKLHFPRGDGKANLHNGGNCPQGVAGVGAVSGARIKHYGYLTWEERQRKYEFYNKVDPNNEAEDCYRHIVEIPGARHAPGPTVLMDWVEP